jgi:hypothetical protein
MGGTGQHIEATMKRGGKFAGIMLALAFILASAYIADAGTGNDMDRQSPQSAGRRVSGNDRDIDSGGTMPVDRDLYVVHYDDVNQFGDDEAFNATTRHTKVPFPFHRER